MDRYAVFGNPIKHSRSPLIHATFAEQCEQQMQYRAVKVELEGFAAAAAQFFQGGGRGLNITVPFKRDAYDFAEQLSHRARVAGAVNTLYPDADGVMTGDNTDGVGLIRDMVANLGWRLADSRILVLGAGGAARGVLEPLLKEHPASLLIVNRTAATAVQLAQEFAVHGEPRGGGYDALEGCQFDVLINATSASLAGELPPLEAEMLTDRSCCYDMMYGAEPTVFMRWAAQNTAWAVADGLGMLVEQAAESFYLWRRQRPQTGPVITALRHQMQEQAS